MRNIKKVGLLIVLLASPALIFLYLVTFTTNHYDLPYFFPVANENGVVQVLENDTVYYTVPTQIGVMNPYQQQCLVSVVSLVPDQCNEDCLRQIMNMSVVQEVINEFDQNCFKVYRSIGAEQLAISDLVQNVTTIDSLQYQELQRALKMDALEAKGANTVLLDSAGRIRGFFRLHDKIELDRLFAEVKILNHNLSSISK